MSLLSIDLALTQCHDRKLSSFNVQSVFFLDNKNIDSQGEKIHEGHGMQSFTRRWKIDLLDYSGCVANG